MTKKIIYVIFAVVTTTLCFLQCKNEAPKQQPMATLGDSGTPTRFASICPAYPIPAGFKDTFSLSQNYPDTFDVNASKPWTKFDFKKDYQNYMAAVLDYCMEGNIEVDFKVQDNKVRKWYAAPWMHDDGNSPATGKQNAGREYLHGLTREITIKAKTLGDLQTTNFQTYATSFYNAPGGYTIGKVWKNADNPDINQSNFPEGTVTFKLLFTEADTMQVPYLANSKQWTANIFVPSDSFNKRVNTPVRLLQLDIAIKDKTAESGWIFGTFVYNAASKGLTWKERMAPVGLMWGDDSKDTTMLNITNRYNPSLKQSVINQSLLKKNDKVPTQAYVTHLGMGGRMNGPVDNPISSCISCHAHAALNAEHVHASMANFGVKKYSYQDFVDYFSDIPCGVQTITQKDKNFTTTDFSYQLLNGLRNFYAAQPLPMAERGLKTKPKPIPMVSRDGHSE